MKNWAPLIVLLVLVALLVVLFGPGIYRGILLRRSVGGLLDTIRAGRTTDIVAAVEPGQQQDVAELLAEYLPPDYSKSIGSLRLVRTALEGETKAVTIVTCKLVQGEYMGVYQGQLVWHYTGGRWQWDFLASSGAEYMPGIEPAWIRLVDLMPQAEAL
jgi:hypothetical protein